MKNESLRQVSFEEALALARRLNCSAIIETSSKDEKTLGVLDGLFDSFLICALNCYENSIRCQAMINGGSSAAGNFKGGGYAGNRANY